MGKQDTETEHKLVINLSKDNILAFNSLYKIYSVRLYRFAFSYLKNAAEAEELVQEVFEKVWENRQRLKTELSFRSYLFTIALNQIRKHFNKKATSLRYLESLTQDAEYPVSFQDDSYESNLQQINLIIEQLPPRRREIFIKSKLEGKSSKVVAQELNISAGTVDNQVSEALRFIRSQLKTNNIAVVLFACLFVY